MSEDEILDDIGGLMHGPMSRFIQKYFGHFQYVHEDGLLNIELPGRASSQYFISPSALLPDDFFAWFSDYISGERDWRSRRMAYTKKACPS